LAYVLVWFVATTITVSGSWLGIRSMLQAGSPQRSAPLSAADLRQAAPTTAAPSPSPTPSPSPSPKPTRSPSKSPRAARPSPSQTPGWVRVADEPDGGTFQRRFRVTGGEAVVVVSAEETRVVSVRPARNFRAQVDEGQGAIRISFLSERRVSRVLFLWRDGPYAEVSESV
jgi:hypothetical protein